jgi:hypothetical protein
MKNALQAGGTAAITQPVTVHGLGGIGKSNAGANQTMSAAA